MRDPTPNEEAVQQLVMTARGFNPFNESTGLKFQEPPMPMDKLERAQYHMRYRYDEGISLLTRLLMRDGKLSKAQNVSHIAPSSGRDGPLRQHKLGRTKYFLGLTRNRTWPCFSTTSAHPPRPG